MKADLTKTLDSYAARHGQFRILDVPSLQYLMVDSHGPPGTVASIRLRSLASVKTCRSSAGRRRAPRMTQPPLPVQSEPVPHPAVPSLNVYSSRGMRAVPPSRRIAHRQGVIELMVFLLEPMLSLYAAASERSINPKRNIGTNLSTMLT